LLAFPGALSGTGVAVVLRVAAVVLTFAGWQLLGIVQAHRAAAPGR
jgi:hypothetical protein